jgi:two-component system phosphate regulon sensor histidine kinase PhoR
LRLGMQSEIWRVVLVTLLSFTIGLSLDKTLEALLVGLILYILWSYRIVSKLFNWIDRGMRNIPPDTDGVWGEFADTLNRQRRRHRRAQEKMRRTIKRVTRVTEAVDEGVLVLFSDRTLDWWNQSAKQLLGLRSTDRGSAITNLIRDPLFVSYINQRNFDETIQLPSALQPGRLLDFSATVFGEDEIVLLITDITQVHNLELVRKEFVGNISHELRTPLTVMRGYIDTLSDVKETTPMVEKALQQMSCQVDRMQTLADDIILLSKLESTSQHLSPEKINLLDCLTEIMVEAEHLSSDKHSLTLDCAAPFEIEADAKSTRSALGNIVFNAILHNPQGAHIQIKVTETIDTVTVSVKDNGVGIDAEEIPRLTERFYRGDSSRNSNTGGTGLGLAIVKHSLNSCGGALTIKANSEGGAEFICSFPKPVH